MSARLFVVDGPGYLYRAYHALPYLSNSKGQPSNAVFGMSTMLWKLLRDESPEYAAVAWDPPGPTFREAKLPSYKETRPGMPDDLRSQIALVMRVFEALRLPLLEVPGFEADDVLGTLREALAANRPQALLSRELATVSTRVPIAQGLEDLRRQEPDWERLRALWKELEFHTLIRQIPASAPAAVAAEALPTLEGPEALERWLGAVPADAPFAVDWVGEGAPPEPTLSALGLFHPAAGAAILPLGSVPPELGGRRLIGHDVKPMIEWWLARGGSPPAFEDTAVGAYLLNPARTNYKLDEVSAELLGEGPGLAAPGTRARWVWKLWEMLPRALKEVGLDTLYEEVERPLVPVLATMERHGIRVDPGGLEAFSKELDGTLVGLTRQIYTLAGGEFNIGSPKQLAEVLFEKLKLPPVKKTKTGYSTDADVLEQLALGHELPAKIIEHRTLAKLKSTYADALPELIHPSTGRIHTSFNQLVAATGRLSCLPTGTLVNTQNGLVGIE